MSSELAAGMRFLMRFLRPVGVRLILIVVLASLTCCGFCQIGGKTAADGPFTLENVEDLDLNAAGVMRDWIPDYVPGQTSPLQAISLSGTTLTLAANQTPIGALRFRMPTDPNGYVDYSFGIPMPGVAGASTLTSPGDIRSFQNMTFEIWASTSLPNQAFQVILESYPETTTGSGVYPRMYWNFDVPINTEFNPVTLNLHAPDLVENAGALTVDDLLSKTRFLSFYFFGGPQHPATTLETQIDDIRFVPPASVDNWVLY